MIKNMMKRFILFQHIVLSNFSILTLDVCPSANAKHLVIFLF